MKKNIKFNDYLTEEELFEAMDKNIKVIEKALNTKIIVTTDALIVDEAYEEVIIELLEIMAVALKSNGNLKQRMLESIISMINTYPFEKVKDFYAKIYQFTSTYDGRIIKAHTINQKLYLDALNNSDIVLAIGAAGSGKTYLAVGFALNLLKKNKIKKIVITRPVVEAGERLGFLPGDLKEKIDPYLRPIYDAIYDIIGMENAKKYLEKEIIEIAPLAYMRGRTIDNAYIILDEAQNTTKSQMKMFLTRLGFNSKMVITGDTTQIDLPNALESGLIEAAHLLNGIDGVGIVKFEKYDVMRHPLVSEIIKKYEDHNK